MRVGPLFRSSECHASIPTHLSLTEATAAAAAMSACPHSLARDVPKHDANADAQLVDGPEPAGGQGAVGRPAVRGEPHPPPPARARTSRAWPAGQHPSLSLLLFPHHRTHLPRMAGGASSEMNMGAVEEKTPTEPQAREEGGAVRTDSRDTPLLIHSHVSPYPTTQHTPPPRTGHSRQDTPSHHLRVAVCRSSRGHGSDVEHARDDECDTPWCFS